MQTKIITYSILSAIIASILVASSTNANFNWLSSQERTAVKILIQKYKTGEELTDTEEVLVRELKKKYESNMWNVKPIETKKYLVIRK